MKKILLFLFPLFCFFFLFPLNVSAMVEPDFQTTIPSKTINYTYFPQYATRTVAGYGEAMVSIPVSAVLGTRSTSSTTSYYWTFYLLDDELIMESKYISYFLEDQPEPGYYDVSFNPTTSDVPVGRFGLAISSQVASSNSPMSMIAGGYTLSSYEIVFPNGQSIVFRDNFYSSDYDSVCPANLYVGPYSTGISFFIRLHFTYATSDSNVSPSGALIGYTTAFSSSTSSPPYLPIFAFTNLVLPSYNVSFFTSSSSSSQFLPSGTPKPPIDDLNSAIDDLDSTTDTASDQAQVWTSGWDINNALHFPTLLSQSLAEVSMIFTQIINVSDGFNVIFPFAIVIAIIAFALGIAGKRS